MSFELPIWVSSQLTAMAEWGVIPSLAYIIRVAACPTCYSLELVRRVRAPVFLFYPELGGIAEDFSVSVKNVSLTTEAGCQFCAVLSNIFSHIFVPESRAIYSPEAIVSVFVPMSFESRRAIHVTFNYKAAQANTNLVQSLSKRFYLTTVNKCTRTI
jgi:hypothetical protein